MAILANAPERMPEKKEKIPKELKDKRRLLEGIEPRDRVDRMVPNTNHHSSRNNLSHNDVMQTKFNKLLKEMEDLDKVQVVKLGDASIASPFTSRLSSIMCGLCFFYRFQNVLLIFNINLLYSHCSVSHNQARKVYISDNFTNV